MLEELLKLLKLHGKELGTGMGAVALSFSSIYLQGRKKDREKVEAVLTAVDQEQNKALEKQNELIKVHTAELAKVNAQLAAQQKQIGSITEAVLKMKTKAEVQEDIERFARRIQTMGFSLIKTFNTRLDSASRAMIIEGCAKASVLFTDILRKGITEVDTEIFRIEAISNLRSIRAQYTGGTRISKKQVTEIKNRIAYPRLDQLLADIVGLKDSANAGWESEYKNIVIEFVKNFIVEFCNILPNEAQHTNQRN